MPWKIALIGTGNLGYLWADYLKDLPHVKLRARASNPAKSQAFCEQFDLSVYDPSESWTPDFILLCLKDDQFLSFGILRKYPYFFARWQSIFIRFWTGKPWHYLSASKHP